MKDCWQKEPEKRLEFTKITMRLKYPYHNYDVPPGSDLTEEAEEPKDKEAAKPGNVKSTESFFLSEDSRDSTFQEVACLSSLWPWFDSGL